MQLVNDNAHLSKIKNISQNKQHIPNKGFSLDTHIYAFETIGYTNTMLFEHKCT